MAISVCSYCGGLVMMHATMCGHCGQRGEAIPSRRRVSSFGRRHRIPLPVRRLMIVAVVGTGAALCLALANWVRPTVAHSAAELAVTCREMEQTGEDSPALIRACKAQLAQRRIEEQL